MLDGMSCNFLMHLTNKEKACEMLISVLNLAYNFCNWSGCSGVEQALKQTEPFVTTIQTILSKQKVCEMNQNSALKSLKAFQAQSIALPNTFQTRVTANKIKSSEKSENITSNNHEWLTMANTS